MRFALTFSEFINESATDKNWRDSEIWKILQEFGYVEIEENKKGNVRILDSTGRAYVLTTGGYIRDPLRYGSSNSIVKSLPQSPDLFINFLKYFFTRDLKKIKEKADPSLIARIKKIEEDIKADLIKEPLLTFEQNLFLAYHVVGSWKYDPNTKRVNVEGSVSDKRNTVIGAPSRIVFKNMEGLKFGTITGDFMFPYKTEEEDVIEKVLGSFRVENYQNKNLMSIPKYIGNEIIIFRSGQLTSLKGCPDVVNDFRILSVSELDSLEGGPLKSKNFSCVNSDLMSLKGSPDEVKGNFNCSDNKLTTLEGAPKEVGGGFNCSDNKLTSLVGAPNKIEGDFNCTRNNLTSLVGAPNKIEGRFFCNEFSLQPGEWGFRGWLNIFISGREKAKELIITLLNPEFINTEIQKDPEGMMMNLKGVWNSPEFSEIRKEIKIPDRYKGEMDTLADLDDLGF